MATILKYVQMTDVVCMHQYKNVGAAESLYYY